LDARACGVAAEARMVRKVAVLGGGLASLATVYELTNRPGWRDRFDITVYQMGHRLGGKCASSCNPDAFHRVEEHGLHVFWGFYENALRILRECYDELGRPPGAPLATFEQALRPHDWIVVPEKIGEDWDFWPVKMPRNGRVPGVGRGAVDDADAYVPRLLELAAQGLGVDGKLGRTLHASSRGLSKLLDRLAERFLDLLERADTCRRLRIQIDLALTVARGLLADDLALPPRDWLRLDDESLRDWLRRHGAREETLGSALLEGLHAALYSSGLDIGAGTAVHGLLRMVFTYRGAILYEMQAGMGETVIAPIYQVLARRGVRFEFFHAVSRLELSADGTRVARVHVDRQATPKADYQPLIDVGGLPCWPTHPLYDQLVEGEALRCAGRDLESWWDERSVVEERVLEHGRDFDEVVLGISIGAFRDICGELIDRHPRFSAMVANVATTLTQSAQLWLGPDLPRLGWEGPPPIVIPYAAPMDTWADMTHLLARESRPASASAGCLVYLTARLEDDEPTPPRGPSDYPQRQTARVRGNTEAWLKRSTGGIWPRATTRHDPNEINWYWLVDPEERRGAARLDAQYFAEIRHPSDRYVLSLPGTSKYRLRPDESGCENLVLAGDWTLNSLNGGCVEAAVMSGVGAARVLDAGVPRAIGDWLGQLDEQRRPRTRPEAHSIVAAASQPARLPPHAAMRATRRDLPRYVRRDGELLATPPIALDIDVSMFVLRADPQRLTELLDAQLNHDDRHCYRPLLPVVVLYCSRVDNYPVDEPLGWVPELDFGIWVPAIAGEMRGGAFRPDRVVTFTPYIWVSNDVALTNGRSFFGFTKDLGAMTMPHGPEDRSPFTLDTQVIPRFGPESPIEQRRLLEVRRANDEGATSLRSTWESGRDIVRALGDSARHLRDPDVLRSGGFALARALWRDAPRGQRMVFLKQLPDVVDGRRACYQAVVEADIRITSEVTGGPLSGRWEVDIEAFDSHRIVDTLGLVSQRREGRRDVCAPLAQGFARFSACVDEGRVVWEA
jgi:uncharacterized protein with NAD-binding domain and iron-sulfur cluster